MDGYPLAKQGKGGYAIGLAAISSAIGTFFGLLCLATISPLLGTIALKFGSWEFFVLAVFGVIICGNLTAPKDPLKGWVAGLLGLLLSLVGQDPIQALPRFTFGSLQLLGGFSLIPVLVGAYGVGEIVAVMKAPVEYIVKAQIGKVIPPIRDFLANWKHIYTFRIYWSYRRNYSRRRRGYRLLGFLRFCETHRQEPGIIR